MRNDERHLVKIKDAVKQILTVMLCVGIIVTSMPTSAFASVEDDFGTDTVQRIQDSDDAAGTEDIVSPVTNPEGTAAGGSASEEPTVEEPTVEEPTEIISDEPENTEGTVLNEPTAEDPTAEDPAAEDPTAEDPAAPVDTQAEREQIIAEIEAAIAALPAPETLTAEMVEGDTDLTRSLDHLDELFRTLETFLNEDEEDALSLLSGEAQAYYLAVLNAVGALAEQSTLAEESIVITEKKSWSFDWIWDDAIAREHNLITRPEGPITGWVRWLASTIDDGPLCIEENALAKIKVTVKSEDGTVVLPEETTLAEFYHNFCGYSWRDIHDQNLLGMDEKANADDPNSVLIAPVHEKYPEDDGVGEFIFAFSKAGQSYTVTYSVEPTGANSDYTVTSEQVDGRWVLTAASNVDEKVSYIETLIEGLSAAGDITADMKEEEFNLLKSKLEALDGQLADLKSLLGENEIEPLSLLSDAAQSKYNLVKNAYRLTEIEKRIAEVQVMNLEGLSPDGISALRTELNGLMMEAVDLRNFFGEDQLDLYKRAETARSTLRNQISSLNGDNILLNASKITVSSLNGDAVTFTWQWNDQNIQQVGASRPTGNLLGSMSLDENGKPVTTDSYMNVTVYVTGAGATESMSLLEFLCDVCGYDGAYIQEHFADLVAANDETRTSDSRGGSVVFTWNPGRLITAYTDEYGNPFTVSYGVEPGNEIPGYQVTQSEDNLILTATPATDFNATVIWYDNRNQYEDEQGNNTRPTPETYKTELQVVRVYTNAEGEKVTETFPGENYNIDIVTHTGDDSHPDETWDISLPGLPKYGPNGELYTYYLKQITDDTTGKLPSEVNTGAAYTPSVYNGGLLDTEHPEYIANNGQVTNTLSREDKVTIKKMWNDNAIDPENRPETTLYFYRVAETEVVQKNEATGDYEIIGFKGSPVPNYDSISGIEDMEPDAAGYTTVSLPNDGTTLPMFDNYGRRYIYFAVEQMSDKGDYVTQIDDTKAGPILLIPEELELVRQEAGKLNYILNGATVNNKLESTVNVPVTVDFRAQAIQNNMENTTVTLQLQYWDTSIEAWQSYFKIYEDGTEYDGTLTLEDFHPETTTLSGSSEPVDKYDPNGNKIQYRWVQTNMTVNDGTPVDPLKTDGEDWEDLNQENVELTNTGSAVVGPGVGDDKTTLYFDIQYGEDEDGFTTITNILVGNTQVKASKTWIYKETKDDGTAGKTYVYPGGNWDGTSIDDADAVLPAGAKWPYELTLTYDVLRNGAPYLGENREPVTLTMEAGTTEATLPGLPRYDQNGNEYEYTLVEHVPDGWDSSRSYTNSVENDLSEGRDGDQVTQLNGNFNNYIGPGKILTFEVSKNWEDDTDIETRYPVQVAVFNIETGKMVENTLHTLELSNKWNVQISIDAEDDDTVDNYIVKEVQVGPDGVGVPVQYSYSDTELAELAELAKSFYEDQVEKGDPFIENQYNQDALEKYIAGTLAADGTDENGILEFYYNVYLSVNQTGNDHEYCTIYNQRYAEQEMLLEKTWVNNGQKSTASFVLERQEGDEWKTVETFELSTENKTVDNGTVKASWSSKEEKLNLPKYDARGALYNYQIRETEMSIVDGSGAELTHEIVDGIADFSEGENGKPNADRYTCIVSQDSPEYAQNKWLENEKQGASPHHSGDIFTWSGRNVRRDSNDITVYKVWRDGAGPLNEQDPANRPDICFHLYRLSHNQLLDIMGDTSTGELSTDQLDACVNWMKDTFTSESSIQGYVEAGSIQRVNEDYFWTTSTVSGVEGAKVNNWLWKCDLSEAVDRYASDGSPYIYFLFEEMRGNSDGYQASYCNEEKDVIWKEGSEAGIKGGEASTTEGTFNWEKNMDSSFLLISDGGVRGEDFGEYYARTVVNTRQREAHVSGQKTWNIADAQMYIGGDGNPYVDMPAIELRLYRAAASVKDGKFVAPSFDDAVLVDTLVVEGDEDVKYKYEFPSETYGEEELPRYDEFGYRYTYWITEEQIDSYTSENMDGQKTNTGAEIKFGPEADNFNITNTFMIAPPYVEISLKKAWEWLGGVPEDKKNLTVKFELHAVMVDAKGNKIDGRFGDEIFDTQTITVTDGKPDNPGLTFTKATTGSFAGKNLPYYAPNGRPYKYYIVETCPDGYTVTAEVTTEAQTSGNLLADLTSLEGSLPDGLTDGAKAVGTYGDTGLFKPVLGADGLKAEATVEYKNTYDGKKTQSLGVEKAWNDIGLKSPFTDKGELTNLRPESISVKLYRQWKVNGTQYAWEQVTKPDDQGIDTDDPDKGWAQMESDGQLKLEKSNDWKLKTALAGLYQVAPNGETYEYFVVEQDENLLTLDGDTKPGYYAELSDDVHPDVNAEDTDSDNNGIHIVEKSTMERQLGYSESVQLGNDAAAVTKPENDLLYKEVKYSKQWEQQLGGSDETAPLTMEVAEELKDMGALPANLHFVVQYQLGETGEWYYLPTEWVNFDPNDSTNVKTDDLKESELASFVHKTYSSEQYIKTDMSVSGSWNYLPAYYEGTEINYRVVEIMEFTDPVIWKICEPNEDGVEATDDIVSSAEETSNKSVTAPKVEETADAYTNTIQVKPLVLRKVWVGDNANRDNTRPESITIEVKDPDHQSSAGITAVLTREENLVENLPDNDGNIGNIYQSETYYVLSSLIKEKDNPITTSLVATEMDVPGYTKSDEIPLTKETVGEEEIYVFTATNTLTDQVRKTTNLEATKEWKGETGVNWGENMRPKISFTLEYRYKKNSDGQYTAWMKATKAATGVEEAEATKEVTGDSSSSTYKVTWEDVFQYYTEDGTAIAIPLEYHVVEEMYDASGDLIGKNVRPYTASGNGLFTDVTKEDPAKTTIRNTLKTVNVTAAKSWNWKNEAGTTGTLTAEQLKNLDAMGVLPSYILFELYYKTEGTTEGTIWTKVDNPDVFGPQIVKVVAENASEQNTLLTNTYQPRAYTSAQKLPKYDQNGKELQYRLVETGVYYGEETSPGTDQFSKVTWADAQTVDSGTAGSFDVAVTKNSSTQTTTTNTLPVGSLTVTKNWADMENRDGLQKEITIELYRDGGDDPIDTIKLNAANNWSYTWNDLPVYQNGTEAKDTNKSVYKVVEKTESLPQDYEATVSTKENLQLWNNQNSVTAVVENEHDPYKLDISAEKVWNDEDNKYGLRPTSVTLQLEYSFDGTNWEIVKYNENGFSGNSEISFSQVEVKGTKLPVSDADKDNPTVTLISTDAQDSNTWGKVTWKDLPANAWEDDSGSKPVKYRVVEKSIANGYTSENSEAVNYDSDSKDVQVENSLKLTKVTASKNWVNDTNYTNYDSRPANLIFKLQYRTSDSDQWADFTIGGYSNSKVLTKVSNWDPVVFDKLPVEDTNGNIYQYRVVETSDVTGYIKANGGISGTSDAADGKTAEITNTLDTVKISGSKVWDDYKNRDDKRPASITIHLFADGNELTSKTVTAADADENGNWAWSFENLPKYTKDGKEITYTITEDTVPDYTTDISNEQLTDSTTGVTTENPYGFTVTNSHTPETLEISAEKVWYDENNTHGLRPTEVKLQLQYRLSDTEDWKVVPYDVAGFEDESEVSFNAVTGGTLNDDGTVKVTNEGTNGNIWKSVTWKGLPAKAGTSGASSHAQVQYRVTEIDTAAGYTSVASGEVTSTSASKDVRVTNTLKGTTWIVSKKWAPGEEDILAARELLPDQITVQLRYRENKTAEWKDVANGSETLTEANGWTHTFENLREDYQYCVKEVSMTYDKVTLYPDEEGKFANGMTVTSSELIDAGDGTTVVGTQLTNTLETTRVTADKEWEDQNNKYNTREDVTFKLQYKTADTDWTDVPDNTADGSKKAYTKTLTESSEWDAVTFENLPVKDLAGNAYQYKVVETTEVPGYTCTGGNVDEGSTAAKITNTLPTVNLKVTKTWEDQNNDYSTRPENLQLTVYYKDDAAVGGKTPLNPQPTVTWIKSENNTWTAELQNLPEYIPGTSTKAEYLVEEEVPTGYNVTSGNPVAVNAQYEAALKNELITVNVNGSKTWVDNNDQDGIRPKQIEIHLFRDGTEWKSKTVTEADGWKWSFENLPKYDKTTKKEIVYSIQEISESGYSSKVTGYNVTNTHNPDTLTVSAEKVWEDENDPYGQRPTSVSLQLQYSFDSKNWTGAKYEPDGSDKYTVSFTGVTGGTRNEDGTVTVTNEGANRNSWQKVTWNGMPAKAWQSQDADGPVPVQYRVIEVNVPAGYTSKESAAVTYESNTNVQVENTLNPISWTVSKNWAPDVEVLKARGLLPKEITVQLKYSDDQGNRWENVAKGGRVSLNEANGWTHTFENLRKDYQYCVEEVSMTYEDGTVDGTVIYPDEQGKFINGMTVTSSEQKDKTDENVIVGTQLTNTLETTRVTASKVWEDQNNKYKTREDLTFKLQYSTDNMTWDDVPDGTNADGSKKVYTKTLTESSEWDAVTFENLPVKDLEGNAYQYKVVEITDVPGYTKDPGEDVAVDVPGSTAKTAEITNILPMVDLEVTKTWEDQNNAYNTRPDDLELTVYYKDDAVAGGQTLLDPQPEVNWKENGKVWTAELEGLPKYIPGTKTVAQYTVEEAETAGYRAEGDVLSKEVGADHKVSFTNTLETVNISGSKTWEDADDRDDKRPKQIVINLLSNGTVLKSTTVTADENDNWAWTFENVPKFTTKGEEIEYTITEEEVPDYTTDISKEQLTDSTTGLTQEDPYSFTVVNNHTPETLDISAEKVWKDESDKYELRPKEVILQLQYLLEDGKTWKAVPYDADGFESCIDVSFSEVTGGTPVLEDSSNPTVIVQDDGDTDINIWEKVTWKGLPAKAGALGADSHAQVQYRVAEINTTDGYDSAASGIVTAASASRDVQVTNSLKGTSWTVSKAWVPGEDILAARELLPDQITVQLQYSKDDGAAWENVTKNGIAELTADHQWQYTFSDLREDYQYRAVEVSMTYGEKVIEPDDQGRFDNDMVVSSSDLLNADGSSVIGTLLTNTLEITSVTAGKVWEDSDNRYDTRPASLTFKLQYSTDDGSEWTDVPNGSGTAYTRVLTEPWDAVTFENLPVKDLDGNDYRYKAVEISDVPGYEKMNSGESVADSDNHTAKITNALRTVDLEITKNWEDLGDLYQIRPEDLALTVFYNDVVSGELIALDPQPTVTWKKIGDVWKAKLEELPKYIPGTDTEAVYTVKEEVPTGYIAEGGSSAVVDEQYKAALTNRLETVNVKGSKVWNDQENDYHTRPDSLKFKVQYSIDKGATWTDVPAKDGKAYTLEMKDPWKEVVFENLPMKDQDEKLYQYKVVEITDVPGYEKENKGESIAADTKEDTIKTVEIANTLLTVDLEVTKNWVDQSNHYQTRPEDLQLSVYYTNAKGKLVLLDAQPEVSWQKNGDVWTAKLTGLPKYIPGTDTEAEYTVTETEAAGYHAAEKVSQKAGADHKVSFTNELETINIAGSKTWEDHNDQDGKRPASITIRLYADGTPMEEHVIKVTGKDEWKWSFQNLPKYNTDGREVVYTITEDAVKDYKTAITGSAEKGFVVTNSHTPEQTGGGKPKTGDHLDMALWLALMLCAFSSMTGVVLTSKKRRKE